LLNANGFIFLNGQVVYIYIFFEHIKIYDQDFLQKIGDGSRNIPNCMRYPTHANFMLAFSPVIEIISFGNGVIKQMSSYRRFYKPSP